MTIIYRDRCFRDHLTGSHPETPQRLVSVEQGLNAAGWFERCATGAIVAAPIAELAATHAPQQIEQARALAANGGGHLDPDTVLSAASYSVAMTAAGTAIAAVDHVMNGVDSTALCLIRPPGHHATASRSMGFCIFNNVAVAARHALTQHGATKVLIIDWDVHHGNGTQDIFYEDPAVYFFSIHRFPFYPGSGEADEIGSGAGRGTTLNIPVRFGTSREHYLALFRSGLEKAVAAAKPDLILISAGFDAHMDDPVGSLGLATEDFGTMTQLVVDAAKSSCQGRIVSCLEGGYNVKALAASVRAHLEALAGQHPT